MAPGEHEEHDGQQEIAPGDVVGDGAGEEIAGDLDIPEQKPAGQNLVVPKPKPEAKAKGQQSLVGGETRAAALRDYGFPNHYAETDMLEAGVDCWACVKIHGRSEKFKTWSNLRSHSKKIHKLTRTMLTGSTLNKLAKEDERRNHASKNAS